MDGDGDHPSWRGAVLVCGTASGVGKSTIVAGLCRLLARGGCRVAPFKAQNMSNHAAVTADGGEVGRAQAMQAAAAGVDLERGMNPILLKPGTDRTSHVVIDGREVGTTDAGGWGEQAAGLRSVVSDALDALRRRFDVVVAEGAGGAAEVNLLERDLVNLPLAAATGTPVVLVADIDRGGALAAAHGTIDLVPERLRATIGGIVFNRFRGDPSLLRPGIDEITRRTGVPVLGVLPHLGAGPLLGTEDSLDLGQGHPASRSDDPVRVAAVRLPHLANPSDLDPLTIEPDVDLRWASAPAHLRGADLVVVPGSRATVADLDWLHGSGLADALADCDADVVGICAGQQMLGRRIADHVESGAGEVEGLGLVPVETVFGTGKVVRQRRGSAGGEPVRGYQIHLGRSCADGPAWVRLHDEHGSEDDGALNGRVRTTSLHGVLDADRFRTRFLDDLAARRRRTYAPAPHGFGDALRRQHDRLADWVAAHLDLDALHVLVARAAAPGSGPGW